MRIGQIIKPRRLHSKIEHRSRLLKSLNGGYRQNLKRGDRCLSSTTILPRQNEEAVALSIRGRQAQLAVPSCPSSFLPSLQYILVPLASSYLHHPESHNSSLAFPVAFAAASLTLFTTPLAAPLAVFPNSANLLLALSIAAESLS